MYHIKLVYSIILAVVGVCSGRHEMGEKKPRSLFRVYIYGDTLTKAESHLTSVRTSFSKAATTPLMLCSASASSGLMKDPENIV